MPPHNIYGVSLPSRISLAKKARSAALIAGRGRGVDHITGRVVPHPVVEWQVNFKDF
jgi:hypothetical protein